MGIPERLARTLAFTGFLLSALGLIFPVLADFREFNGFDCLLFFLNSEDTRAFSVLLALFFLGSLAGIVLCLRRTNTIAPIVALELICLVSGLFFCLRSGLGLSVYGWAAACGAAAQIGGGLALVFLKLKRRERRS